MRGEILRIIKAIEHNEKQAAALNSALGAIGSAVESVSSTISKTVGKFKPPPVPKIPKNTTSMPQMPPAIKPPTSVVPKSLPPQTPGTNIPSPIAPPKGGGLNKYKPEIQPLAPAAPSKIAQVEGSKLLTPLLPHQQRVVDKMREQEGLIVVHGLGSGKTLTSIGVQDALKTPTTVVVPAALQENYRKELAKHTKGLKPEIRSLQDVARKQNLDDTDLLVIDEAHRARDAGSSTYKALQANAAKKRLLLTASPFYNHPSDIAPLINLAAGQDILPGAKPAFEKRYIGLRKIKPSFLDRLKGVTPGEVPYLRGSRKDELRNLFGKYIDYHAGASENFPKVSTEDIQVPMTRQQLKLYDAVLDEAPEWMKQKIRSGLPPSKQEAKQLNAFAGAVRQISNSTRAHSTTLRDEPKIEAAAGNLRKFLAENELNKAVVYSNYLDTGISPYKEKLTRDNIPFGEFTGDISPKDRDRLVREYNENKLKVLLLSSAGGEGLDLKGTRLMQILEPHWNVEKIKQVQGRGARYKSHEALPPELRSMRIQRYLATRPRDTGWFAKPPEGAIDEYMLRLGANKEDLINQFHELFPRSAQPPVSGT
jgi:SNF2 family DNA or RNA helicase